MTRHPGDTLVGAIETMRAPVCVGIDPVLSRLPAVLRPSDSHINTESAASSIEAYCVDVLDAVAGHVPAVKFQSACFERYRGPGVNVMHRCMSRARDQGLIVIYDGKRGDIGITAEHYAAAVAGSADWVTANSYLGVDALIPLLDAGLGVFALVRTSNPSGASVQSQQLADGRTVAEMIAAQLHELSTQFVGLDGVSALGAVVGATDPESAGRLRGLLAHQMILVPGYGAQGGGVDEVAPCFENGGRNAIVTASRSVIYAYEDQGDQSNWQSAVANAARQFADDVGRAAGWR